VGRTRLAAATPESPPTHRGADVSPADFGFYGERSAIPRDTTKLRPSLTPPSGRRKQRPGTSQLVCISSGDAGGGRNDGGVPVLFSQLAVRNNFGKVSRDNSASLGLLIDGAFVTTKKLLVSVGGFESQRKGLLRGGIPGVLGNFDYCRANIGTLTVAHIAAGQGLQFRMLHQATSLS